VENGMRPWNYPKNVGLGKEWEYFDGEKSKRKITKIFDLKLDDGRVNSRLS
jgi:hypothetical protein